MATQPTSHHQLLNLVVAGRHRLPPASCHAFPSMVVSSPPLADLPLTPSSPLLFSPRDPTTPSGCHIWRSRHERAQTSTLSRCHLLPDAKESSKPKNHDSARRRAQLSEAPAPQQRSTMAEKQRSAEMLAEASSRGVAARAQLPAHVDFLSSVNNAFVKHVVKLRQSSSYRHACGSVVIGGDVPLREICEVACKAGSQAFVDCLFVLEDRKVPPGIAELTKRVVRVTPAVMRKLSGLDSVTGVEAIGILPFPASFRLLERTGDSFAVLSEWCPFPERLLVLDSIQDPGNLGTLLRTAAAFDWDGVFLLASCCDPFNEKALRASRGACFWIPIASGQWHQLHSFVDVKEIKLYAGEPQHNACMITQEEEGGLIEVDGHSKQGLLADWDRGGKQSRLSMHRSLLTLAKSAEKESLCLVLGSEGQGLSEEVRAACSLVSIPMAGRFESLNVAVAGGILLFTLQKGTTLHCKEA